MSWYRGFTLLTSTRTGKAMVGTALVSSTGTGMVLHRKAGVSGRASLAAGTALALVQLAGVAAFGHRLVRAGEKLAVEAVRAVEAVTGPDGASETIPPQRV